MFEQRLSFALKLVQLIYGLLVLYFVTNVLSSEDQGYYFILNSVASIQVLFELGMTGLVTQFVAHECHLTVVKGVREFDKGRVAFLLSYFVKWYLKSAVRFFIYVGIFGVLYLTYYGGFNVNWFFPLVVLLTYSTILFLMSGALAALEGLHLVREVYIFRFFHILLQTILSVLFFSLGFGLLSVPLAMLLSLSILILLAVLSKYKTFFLHLLNYSPTLDLELIVRLRGLQRRIAVSWIAGFFIFHYMNFVVFANFGPVTGGRLGLTLAMLNVVGGIANSWMVLASPRFSTLIANGSFEQLMIEYNSVFRSVFVVSAAGVAILILVLFFVFPLFPTLSLLSDRFLGLGMITLLCVSFLFNQMVGVKALFVRSFKEEPFMYLSITSAVVTVTFMSYFGFFIELIGIFISHLFVVIGSYLWVNNTFHKFKVMGVSRNLK